MYLCLRKKMERTLWFKNPFNFADEESILSGNRAAAFEFFRDALVNRPTEFAALLHLYLLACRNLESGRADLTQRQREAVNFAREAEKQGIHPTKYTADKLKISHRAAQRLFRRAGRRYEETNMFASAAELHVVHKDNKQTWRPSEKQIRAKMAAMPRTCAACGENAPGKYALCWKCSRIYGPTRSDWEQAGKNGVVPAKWLLPEARRIEREHRRAAINELYKHRGYDYDYEDIEYLFNQAS
jgi:hypothetical protein